MKLLELNLIESGYWKVSVLKGISLSLDENEIFSIVVSNGAGKSTLIKTISGLLKPKKGEIYLRGQLINNLPPHKIVESGVIQVPEARRLFPYMSVIKNLEIGSFNPNARKSKNEAIEKVFDLFPVLKTRKNMLSKTLSGGEQQMLAIGRGIMANPKLLMLDEPSLGLAPIMVEQIFGNIIKINESGVTIILVEQKVDLSLAIATSGCVLENGEIVLHGTGIELLNNDHLKRAYLGME